MISLFSTRKSSCNKIPQNTPGDSCKCGDKLICPFFQHSFWLQIQILPETALALTPREPPPWELGDNHLTEFAQQIVDSDPAVGTFLLASDDSGALEIKVVFAEAPRHRNQDRVGQPFIFDPAQRKRCIYRFHLNNYKYSFQSRLPAVLLGSES